MNIVKSGYGASFLSKGLIIGEIESGCIVPVKIRGFNVRRRFNIIYPKSSNITFLASNFVKFVLSKTSDIVTERV